MSKGVTLEIKGLDELRRKFSRLPERIQKNSLRKAVNAGADPMLSKVRQTANRKSGALKKAMKKKVKTYRKSGTVVALIGADKSFVRDGNKPANYLHLVEDGHIDAKTGRFIPGSHFMRNAYNAERAKSNEAIADKLKTEVEIEASK